MRRAGFAVALMACIAASGAAAEAPAPSASELRGWVEQMKQSDKGPFEAVRWFCRDGSVLPPRPYACTPHGGGIQHGLLSDRARQLRERGLHVANVLASLDEQRFVGAEPDLAALRQIVLERFLIARDDGWIFRRARSYRGALQSEDEEAASKRLLLRMLADPAWREPPRFLLLRELARWLPLQGRDDVAIRVRVLAAQLGDADAGFGSLRARIHSVPEARDAERVRAYARSRASAEPYEALARAIDQLFAQASTASELGTLAASIPGALGESLRSELPSLASDLPRLRVRAAARSLEAIRRELPPPGDPAAALLALRASLLLEREAFVSGRAAAPLDRRGQLQLVEPLAAALYGTGLIGERHLGALRDSLARISDGSPELGRWRSELAYLLRAAEWSRRWLLFHFGHAMHQLDVIEPLAAHYEADRLRGSPLLPYTAVLDALVRDAQQLAGVEDRVLGSRVGSGLRALNAGVAQGRVRSASSHDEVARLTPDSIALLPETVSELPPVAAILTLGEGSSLSHVQLLARNLGIPNAVVSDAVATSLRALEGELLEVAVSPGGVVQIDRVDGLAPEVTTVAAASDTSIRVSRERLDLEGQQLLPLDELRADDSGRSCGPKAANLGELRAHFGERVPAGFVIPFGVFHRLLEAPMEPGGATAFRWLQGRYRASRSLQEEERAAFNAETLARMRSWIGAQDPGPAFRRELARSLARLGAGGVYVRSDTNVEDLPGFTGAGLNLTLPNVVGGDQVLAAIQQVWASPFGERAHAWRQAYMETPEWVLPSVLVQRAFDAEKSGVMLTASVESGDPGVLSVAVGEGLGGAVDGQAAESLRIDRASGHVRFLAQATSPLRSELNPAGGLRRRPASGRETLLEPGEIAALIELAERVRDFPALRGPDGTRLPADVEFAFRDGELALLQIRPFLTSKRASQSARLRALDEPLRARAALLVDLAGPLLGALP